MTQTSTFRSLHQIKGQPLLLPNVWDAGGAAVVESIGAKAVATTSAGVAWSLGYADGNHMPVDKLASVAAGIVRAVTVPVSIDVEAGYADNAETVAENVLRVVGAGVAGINLEDGQDQPAVLAKKIEAIKRAAAKIGIDVFINARTDVYLQNLTSDDKKVGETLARAKTYRSAGADGLFVPALTDTGAIAQIVKGTELPINLLAWPGLAGASDLGKLDVRRLSAGSSIAQMLWKRMADLSKAFLASGSSELFATDYMAHGALQGLFGKN